MNELLHGKLKKPVGEMLINLVFPENLYCICCGDLINESRVHGLCDFCIERIDWLPAGDLLRDAVNDVRSRSYYEEDETPGDEDGSSDATETNVGSDTHETNGGSDTHETNGDSVTPKADGGEMLLDELMSCCIYGVYPRRIIYSLKLFGHPYAAKGIGMLMGERVMQSEYEYDMLVPVPMSPLKRLKRGYNQAELLAKAVSRQTGIPVRTDVLFKIKNTASMRGSSGLKRRSLLEGAFKAASGNALAGRKVLLVDDVVTTGSTAGECARTLRSAGAARVGLISFASASKYGII